MARSWVIVTTALYCGPRCSRRPKNVSASSTGDICLVRTRVLKSRMGMKTARLSMVLLPLAIGHEDRARFSAVIKPYGPQRRGSGGQLCHPFTHLCEFGRGQTCAVMLR